MGVSLSKGQKISLKKEGGGALKKVAMGLGWGKAKVLFGLMSKDVDLDGSCILFDGSKKALDSVWFSKLRSDNGAVVHTGDDLEGGGDPNDPNETIHVDLDGLPADVQSVVFVVNSYSGETFKGIPNAFVNVADLATNKEIARYSLTLDGGDYKAFIIAKLSRQVGDWEFQAIGQPVNGGQTIKEIMPWAKEHA
jgi:tellurium resistance protein TerZ